MATMTFYEKLEQIESRYAEITAQLSLPEVLADSARYQKLARTHADLSEIVEKYREWKQVEKGLAEAKQMQDEAEDPEMRQLAHEEEKQISARKEVVERELRLLLVPKDPNDEKNVIVEIRAGTGGDEAALFAADLLQMYQRYAQLQGWRTEVMDISENDLGGVKEAVMEVAGTGASLVADRLHMGGEVRALLSPLPCLVLVEGLQIQQVQGRLKCDRQLAGGHVDAGRAVDGPCLARHRSTPAATGSSGPTTSGPSSRRNLRWFASYGTGTG